MARRNLSTFHDNNSVLRKGDISTPKKVMLHNIGKRVNTQGTEVFIQKYPEVTFAADFCTIPRGGVTIHPVLKTISLLLTIFRSSTYNKHT